MPTLYEEQPRSEEGTGVGLIAGLVLVLAIIALVFLATRAAPENDGTIDITPDNLPGIQNEGETGTQV